MSHYSTYVLVLFIRVAATIIGISRQLIDKQKSDGFNALHLATLNGHVEVVKTLIDQVGLRSYYIN